MIRKFLLKTFALLLFLIITLLLIWFLPVPFPNNPLSIDCFLSILNNKHDLLNKNDSPKIIFIGGSGLFYGIDSETISKELNINVINMGLFAQYGLQFMLEDIKPYIKKNDIVIIVPEYKLLFSNRAKKIHSEAYKMSVYVHPVMTLKYFDTKYKINLISYFKSITNLIKQKFVNLYYLINFIINNKDTKNKYTYFSYGNISWQSYMNEYGDFISNKRRTPKFKILLEKNDIIDKYEYINDAIEVVNNFNDFTNKIGAKSYFMFSCLPETDFNDNKTTYLSAYNKMLIDMKMPIISPPENYIFPESYFLESVNHMNAYGKEERTKIIIKDLKSILAK